MTRKITEQEIEVFNFLNELRESGATNMFGARPYIQAEFPKLEGKEAERILLLWMKNFSPDGQYDIITEKIRIT